MVIALCVLITAFIGISLIAIVALPSVLRFVASMVFRGLQPTSIKLQWLSKHGAYIWRTGVVFLVVSFVLFIVEISLIVNRSMTLVVLALLSFVLMITGILFYLKGVYSTFQGDDWLDRMKLYLTEKSVGEYIRYVAQHAGVMPFIGVVSAFVGASLVIVCLILI